MSEEYSTADNKQTDFGFRVDAQAEDPLRPDSPCPPGLSACPCHGWDIPCWVPAHWKNHSLDQTDLCWRSNVSAFEYALQVGRKANQL